MGHQVSAKLHTKEMESKDLEVEIFTTSADGESRSKLGTLLISKGNVEWISKSRKANKKRFTWQHFAEVMEREGKDVRVKNRKTST